MGLLYPYYWEMESIEYDFLLATGYNPSLIGLYCHSLLDVFGWISISCYTTFMDWTISRLRSPLLGVFIFFWSYLNVLVCFLCCYCLPSMGYWQWSIYSLKFLWIIAFVKLLKVLSLLMFMLAFKCLGYLSNAFYAAKSSKCLELDIFIGF